MSISIMTLKFINDYTLQAVILNLIVVVVYYKFLKILKSKHFNKYILKISH